LLKAPSFAVAASRPSWGWKDAAVADASGVVSSAGMVYVIWFLVIV